ncbi:caveolae-associated protein 2-like [Lethenteron reissneri]|uniref:caveolae-associated protein 2-like n=1 Tax=Lethenteron reissneri TaxID=7753 RepID=UPI002AB70505|nr:caveolae-associated protein 2-like [Lethenteron reissneri]
MATLAAAAAVSSGSLDSVPLGGGESRAPESPTGTPRLRADEIRPGPQANAVTVLALLDRLLGMLEGVQEAQRRLEERQRATEGVVRSVAGELSRMARSGQSTDGAVAKVLAKARTVSANVKDVRERLERQAAQVRKLDAKHGDLLRRNNFRILIFQEGSETPTAEATSRPVGPPPGPAVLVSDEARGSAHADSSFEEVCIAGEGSEAGDEAATRPPDLSSDEEYILEEVETTTTRLKKSSMKRMDSLKKAFSKESFEKKMNKFVSPERREKIKKSLTPNHQKSSGSKLGAFKVPPLKFNVKKVRSEDGGGTPNEEEATAAAEEEDADACVAVTNEDSSAIHGGGDTDSAHGAVQYAEIVFADKTPARQAAALASPAGKAVVAAVAAAAVAAAQAAAEARAGVVTLGPDETAGAEKGREQEEEAAEEKPGGRAEGAGDDAEAKVVLGQGEEHEEQKTSGKPEEEEGGEEQHEQGEQQQQQAAVFEAAAVAALSAGEEAVGRPPQADVAPQGPPAVTVSDSDGGAAANGPLAHAGGHAADQGPEEAAVAHGKAAAAVAGGVKTELSE